MKKFIFSAALLTAALASAQNTGIGTTKPDASAKLEVSSTNQGVLLPRLALTSTTVAAPVTAPANGLTVFNTATAGDVTPGYYFWDGAKWVKMLDAKSSLSATEPLQVMGGTTKATSNTENVYQMGKFATGTNNIIEPSAQMEVKANSYFPLIVNSTVTTTDGSPGAGGVALVPNSDMSKRVELSTTQTGNFRIYMNGLGDVLNVNKVNSTLGRSFINTDIAVVKGAGNEQAYIGGDGATNDVQIGSTNNTVTDITAWNWTSGKPMNFSGANLIAQGTVKSIALTGTGDRPLVAMPDGTIKIGGVDNTLNIYTTNGTLTGSGDRTMDQAGKWLNFNNGGVNITGNSGVYFPLIINAMNTGGNGGISIQPNGDGSKRVELNTTPEGNFRLWAEGDKLNIIRSSGNVGIGTGAPDAKLDVRGEARINYLAVRPQDGSSEGGEINLYGTGGKAGSIIDNNSGMTRFFGQDKVQMLSPVQITNIPTGPAGANILVNSGDGTINQVSAVSLASSAEPWQVAGTTNKATDNGQNIYQMGLVGAGTNNPQTQLHIMSGNEHKLRLQQAGQAAWSDIIKRSNGIFGVYNNDGGGNWLGGFFLNGGNFGVGTENPIEKLHVEGSAFVHNPNNSSVVIMSADTNRWAHNAFRVNNVPRWDAGMTGDNGQSYFINSFKDDGTYNGTPFFINRQTNKVGIWNTNPQAQLQVGGGTRVQKGAPGNDSGNVGFSFENDGDTGLFAEGGNSGSGSDLILRNDNGQAITIKSGSGNVGIGTATPGEKLEVAGNIRTNAVIYNSDSRLKTDVANITNATSTINGLRSVTYHWNEAGKAKGGTDALQYGFIAQEVEKVLPSLVFTDDKGFKSVNYVAVVPVLVKALQEKDTEVKSLKSEMDKMKAEIEAIKKSLK